MKAIIEISGPLYISIFKDYGKKLYQQSQSIIDNNPNFKFLSVNINTIREHMKKKKSNCRRVLILAPTSWVVNPFFVCMCASLYTATTQGYFPTSITIEKMKTIILTDHSPPLISDCEILIKS